MASFIGFFIWKETDSKKKNRRVWEIVDSTPLSEQNVKDMLAKLGATAFNDGSEDSGLFFTYRNERY